MHLIYVDPSGDHELFIISALALPVDQWHNAFAQVRKFRRELRKHHGIFVYKELHAWKFVSGRGNPSDRIVTKGERCIIFRQALEMMAALPGARLFNAVFSHKEGLKAFEWTLNRMERSLQAWGSYAMLICDQGNEDRYTKLMRKMYVYNPIPSRYGAWDETGRRWKNIPLARFVEDPVFKDSAHSYFIQLADFSAYALLRRERPIASKAKYGLDKTFDVLRPILVHEANPADPDGIVRP